MYTEYGNYNLPPDDAGLRGRLIGAVATLVALCALLAIVPQHDSTRVANATPCSILSEAEISAALKANMVLMPTSGAVCRYVSTGSGAPTLFVIAYREPLMSRDLAQDGVALHGVGDAAFTSSRGLFVRYGTRSYRFIIVPQSTNDTRPLTDEVKLAKLASRPQIAQNR